MLTAGELAQMRETSDMALPDTVEVRRPATGGTLDPVTGVFTPDPATLIYSGSGRVRTPTAEEYTVIFGDVEVTETRFVGTLPATAGLILIGDLFVVAAGSDPHIGVATFRVTRIPPGSWLISRRLGLETLQEAGR